MGRALLRKGEAGREGVGGKADEDLSTRTLLTSFPEL